MKLLIMQPFSTSSLLGPNIFLRILFLDDLNLFSFLSVGDQVSHTYKATGKIINICILMFKFLDRGGEDKIFRTERQ
jgi:hypothetical protein